VVFGQTKRSPNLAPAPSDSLERYCQSLKHSTIDDKPDGHGGGAERAKVTLECSVGYAALNARLVTQTLRRISLPCKSLLRHAQPQ